MNEKLIEEAKLYIQEIFKNNSDGHDANHSLRVYKNALQIAKAYPECNMMVVALSSFGGKAGRALESSVQHFHDKLLLLKDKMNTQEAKKIAESRHLYMEEFLREFQKESEMCLPLHITGQII